MTCMRRPGRGSTLSMRTRVSCVDRLSVSSCPVSSAWRSEGTSDARSDDDEDDNEDEDGEEDEDGDSSSETIVQAAAPADDDGIEDKEGAIWRRMMKRGRSYGRRLQGDGRVV